MERCTCTGKETACHKQCDRHQQRDYISLTARARPSEVFEEGITRHSQRAGGKRLERDPERDHAPSRAQLIESHYSPPVAGYRICRDAGVSGLGQAPALA
jgi:hypothetical protein